MYSNFLLGSLHVSDAARIKLKRLPLDLIARHAVNDHGQLTRLEVKRNRQNMAFVGPILSRYSVDPTDPTQGRVVVITDEMWESTIVKLESET